MSCGGPLSAVMTIAGAGLLPGAGAIPGVGSALGVNSTLTSALGSFNSLPITSQFSSVVTSATGALSSGTLDSLRTLGANTFPALTNAIPGGFASSLAAVAPGGMSNGGFTGLINSTAQGIMGAGDPSKFSQIFSSAQGFASTANQFINSNLNSSSLASTFGSATGGMSNLLTGSFNQVTQAFGSFGSDLSKLGSLIDTKNLANLGNPTALVQQLANVGGITPSVESALRQVGLDSVQIASVGTSVGGLSNSASKALYQAMGNITGTELTQVKSILGVSTSGINNMADLLNPAKILPNSFTTLTTPTPDGLRGIYSAAGAVNSNLEKFLIDPTAPAYTGDDPIVRARLGLSTTETTVIT